LHLVELVRKRVLKESQLDELVAPMLYWKFQMGLFEDPYVDPDEAARVVGSDTNRKLALQAAREAITLLKNENNIAPLNLDRIKTIAVIGPNADRSLLGGYSGVPKHNSTVIEGIKAESAIVSRSSTAKAARSRSADHGIRTKSSPLIPMRTASKLPRPSTSRSRRT
jgi:beta-glucosidase